LRAALGDVHIDPVGLTRDDWLDLLMTHRIQPQFDDAVMTVVHDWPARPHWHASGPARRRWPSVSSCTWARWSWPTAITN
jgi:elongation factor P--beta-lysine ligase